MFARESPCEAPEGTPDAYVQFSVEGVAVATFSTDQQGQFHGPLLGGTYQLRVLLASRGAGLSCPTGTVRVPQDRWVEVAIDCFIGVCGHST